MENRLLVPKILTFIYSLVHWFQFANGQDASTPASDGINFGTPLPTLSPQELPPAYGAYNKCSIM